MKLSRLPQLVRGELILALSAMICAVLFAVYWLQPDAFAAVTAFPAWSWFLFGVTLAAFGFRRGRWMLAVVIGWLLFAVVWAEEPRSVWRSAAGPTAEWVAAHEAGNAIRVVSLNCYLGNLRTATEVIPYQPDIVFLQESPSRWDLDKLACDLFGDDKWDVLWSPDASIVARGRIEPLVADGAFPFVHGTLTLPTGRRLEVMSLRLAAPVVRFDLWSTSCWREQTAKRREHREEVDSIRRRLERIDKGVPIVIGGDFNAPAGDGALRPLRARVRDTFHQAGAGWGNTVLNDIPVLRFDQIWASDHLRAKRVVARKTAHSDHRLVVCELTFLPSQK